MKYRNPWLKIPIHITLYEKRYYIDVCFPSGFLSASFYSKHFKEILGIRSTLTFDRRVKKSVFIKVLHL